MVYKYFEINMESLSNPPKTDYKNEMQAFVDDQFYNAVDWYTIEEETSFASNVYVDLDVRINSVVNTTTGANRGDDWKKLIFKDIDKATSVGAMFQFSGNYWVTVNTDTFNSLTSSCTVRRCNNTLRWIDATGAKNSIPCVLEYLIAENRDYSTGGSKLVNPSGLLEIISQLNTTTNLIKPNERFLFGNPDNWTAYEIQGGGINNFASLSTESIAVAGLLKITTGVTHLNEEVDDLVLGYANVTERTYAITLDKSTVSGIVTDTFQISALVTLNGASVSRVVDWASSNTSIATVSSSGLVTMVALGTATITASLDGDATVSDTCAITVNTTPIAEYVVAISPETNYLLEGDTQTYNVTLELNGATQVDTFTFAVVAGNVPVANYTFATVDGNNFSLINVEMYMSEALVVRATSGIYTKDFSITLRGAW